jgi:hypothetical protein
VQVKATLMATVTLTVKVLVLPLAYRPFYRICPEHQGLAVHGPLQEARMAQQMAVL